jgi:hypothetical protein
VFFLSLAIPEAVTATTFGVKSLSSQLGISRPSKPPTHLFSIEEDGLSFTDFGSITLEGSDAEIDADALALSPVHGLMGFQITATDSTLITIDPLTAVATSVGSPLIGRDIRGAAFDLAGTLWCLDAVNNELLQIDPLNGQVVGLPIGLTFGGGSFDLTNITDIAVKSDGTFYVSDITRFYTLDPLTGDLTFVHEETGQAFSGLTFSIDAQENDLFGYEINGDDDIYQFDVGAGFTRTLPYPDIIPSINAGRGDLAAEISPQSTGFSNVAFLPGFLGSRLYRIQTLENQLWEANRPADVKKLYLDENTFQSINSDIYTRDIIDVALNGTVYQSFIFSMNQLVSGGIINNWKALPYDWRLPLDDIVSGGLDIGNGNVSYLVPSFKPYIIDQLEQLAQTSASGKVTIVTHSNGGLLAKVLIDEMNTQGKSHLIDRLIMIAAPQLGTPQVLPKLLHGDLGLLNIALGPETVREFVESMPAAYNLLPSGQYFNTVMLDPVVEFDSTSNKFYNFSKYNSLIQSGEFNEFRDFLTGGYLSGTPVEPSPSAVLTPNVLEPILLILSDGVHRRIDTWIPPADIEVIQVAGWGLDTERGIKYLEKTVFVGSTPVSILDHEPLITTDGDGTVVTPSAVAMNGVTTYYVDLWEYNQRFLLTPFKHDRIMEATPVQYLIKNIIQNDSSPVNYVTTAKPTEKNSRLRMHMASPVAVDVFDSSGRHTGLSLSIPNVLEEQIPNSYYWSIGNDIYMGLDTGDRYNVQLSGLALGTFTFEIEEVLNDQEIATLVYTDIPVSPTMQGTMTIQTVGDASQLAIDVEGDGTTDFFLNQNQTLGPVLFVDMLTNIIQTLGFDKGTEQSLLAKLNNAKKSFQKGNTNAVLGQIGAFINSVNAQSGKKISKADATGLIQMAATLKDSLQSPAAPSRIIPTIPKNFALRQNYPDPFNPETWIPYELAADASVEITIYNAGGQRVRTLRLGTQLAGLYLTKEKAAYWDGRSETGELVSSGLYFYHLQAGDFQATKKMLLLK